MYELMQILEAFESLCAAGNPGALATVAAVEGSGYRRPGARMLVAADGRVWGSISGGCLERDVARRARLVIDTGWPDICCYESPHHPDEDENSPGASLGCGGRIDVMIERVSRESSGVLMALADVRRNRRPAMVATIVRVEPAEPPGEVQRLIQLHGCNPEGNISDPVVRAAILSEYPRGARLHRYQTVTGASADVLIERIEPPQAIVIFGDGRDVEPLAKFSHSLGWHVTIVARRQPACQADAVHFATSDEPLGGLKEISQDTAAVVMGHDFRRDAAVLLQLLQQPARYIGILGPRHRTRRLLAATGVDWEQPEISRRLFWPIGLDIGAQTPEQIALAVVAEIQAVFVGREGKHLRDRGGPIHDFESNTTRAGRSWK